MLVVLSGALARALVHGVGSGCARWRGRCALSVRRSHTGAAAASGATASPGAAATRPAGASTRATCASSTAATARASTATSGSLSVDRG